MSIEHDFLPLILNCPVLRSNYSLAAHWIVPCPRIAPNRHGATSKSGSTFVSPREIFVLSRPSVSLRTVHLTVTYLSSFVLLNCFTFLIVPGQFNYNSTLYSTPSLFQIVFVHYSAGRLYIFSLQFSFLHIPYQLPPRSTSNKQSNKACTSSSYVALRRERRTTTIFNPTCLQSCPSFPFRPSLSLPPQAAPI